jgi:hypothetical protein
MRPQRLTEEKRRQRAGVVQPLPLFARVHPGRVVTADPLAPAVQVEPSARFMAREVGVADEPQMGRQVGLGQGLSQPAHARGNAAGPGIGIGPLEGQHMKLYWDKHRHLLITPCLHSRSQAFAVQS